MTRKEFEKQVVATQGDLRRFLVALCCGDVALADDLAQDSYVKAYLSLNTLQSDTSFKPFLYRIAYNTFISSRRTLRLQQPIDETFSISSDENADSGFQYQALYQALRRLSATERTTVAMYYLEGYAVKEIAGLTDTGEDAVRQQLSRGRKHLKDLMKK